MSSELITGRAVERFAQCLENLKDNDKFKINSLTIFARDSKDNSDICQRIVDITIKHVHKIREEKGRVKLYNLRTTWKDIFSNSRMYELDIRVREHDPAWPLLATLPEAKAAFRSLPVIPKIKKESIEPSNVESSDSSSSSRDPRLNRKRKLNDPVNEEYLIDRSGDQKMEAFARKKGKDNCENKKKDILFGGTDLDMRPKVNTKVPDTKEILISEIKINDEHTRHVKDVDMRFTSNVPIPVQIVSVPDPSTSQVSIPTVTKPMIIPPSTNLIDIMAISTESISSANQTQPLFTNVSSNFVHNLNLSNIFTQTTTSVHHLNPSTMPESIRQHHPPTNEIIHSLEPPQHALPLPSFHRDFPPPNINPNAPTRRPPIRGPVWNVEIRGFPDMVNIGVDPRMLSLVHDPKPPRRITIDGCQYPLLLDRIQPLIAVDDMVHAVRLRCERVKVVIDNKYFTIPGTGFTKVTVGGKSLIAYLGGPGHELIIDGCPHTVPFGSHLTFISVGHNHVGVKFEGPPPRSVNVLPPIPPQLLKWGAQGLFGSPSKLSSPPFNPLRGISFLNKHDAPSSKLIEQKQQDPPVVENNTPQVQPVSADKPDEPQTNSSINVHDLFQKLLQAGIVNKQSTPAPLDPPSLEKYSWDRFKLPLSTEIEVLYTGHQCSQCGIRFESDLTPEFATHLDYHYMKNSSDFNNHRSRVFYQPSKNWLLSDSMPKVMANFEPQSPIANLQETKTIAFADPSKNVCGVCFEKFDVYWDHVEEEVMLRDAILVDGKVYHPICQEDAGKEFRVETESTAEPEEAVVAEATGTIQPDSLLPTDNPVGQVKPEIDPPPPFLSSSSFDEGNSTFCCRDDDDDDEELQEPAAVIPGLSPPSRVNSPTDASQLSPTATGQTSPLDDQPTPSPPPLSDTDRPSTLKPDPDDSDPILALKALLGN